VKTGERWEWRIEWLLDELAGMTYETSMVWMSQS